MTIFCPHTFIVTASKRPSLTTPFKVAFCTTGHNTAILSTCLPVNYLSLSLDCNSRKMGTPSVLFTQWQAQHLAENRCSVVGWIYPSRSERMKYRYVMWVLHWAFQEQAGWEPRASRRDAALQVQDALGRLPWKRFSWPARRNAHVLLVGGVVILYKWHCA